jgi:hypothetical protein
MCKVCGELTVYAYCCGMKEEEEHYWAEYDDYLGIIER